MTDIYTARRAQLQKAVIDASLALCEFEGAAGFNLPIKGTTPPVSVTMGMRAALVAVGEQEPVAWMTEDGRVAMASLKAHGMANASKAAFCIPLYRVSRPSLAPVVQSPWISVDAEQKPVGRTPVLVSVWFVRYGNHEDGTPGEYEGVEVTEGEYVPQHGEYPGYFASYQGTHGDASHVTHWMPLPTPPTPAPGKQEGEA